MRFSTLILMVFLFGCASSNVAERATGEGTAGIAVVIGAQERSEGGFSGIDAGDYRPGERSKIKKSSKFSKALSRLDRMLGESRNLYGDDFDPNRAKAPDYKKPKYKSKIAKQILLDELMSSAYDAYKEVTGRRWYSRRIERGKKSGDPLLNPTWWQLNRGRNLHDALTEWGKRANWRVVWRSEFEYPVEVSAVFRGDFLKAVRNTLKAFENRKPRLYATFYKNRVVVFRSEKVE